MDVGDLDRVVQVGCPPSVAAFLQRTGRTGRRAGATRNCVLLAVDEGSLAWAAGLARLWGQGFVEPVAPPEPRHIVAQQLLALCLQERRASSELWAGEWNGLAPFDRSAGPVLRHLVERGFVDQDGGLLFIGPEAGLRFGRRHFTANRRAHRAAAVHRAVRPGRDRPGRDRPGRPGAAHREGRRAEAAARRPVLAGDLGGLDAAPLLRRAGPRRRQGPLAFGGRLGAGHEMARAVRDVLLGADPPVQLTQRARRVLAEARDGRRDAVHPAGTVISRDGGDVRWWTWAGYRANATLAATLSGLADGAKRPGDTCVRMRPDLTWDMWRAVTTGAAQRLCLPDIDDRALADLKFSGALPPRLATATLAARLADRPGLGGKGAC